MKKVDVLFLYETKVRELENICLIKNELEHRGFSVGVANTWNEYGKKKHPYKAKVVVTHAMDNDGLYEFTCDCCGAAPKVVNMQCEQIGRIGDVTNPNSRYALKGIAHQTMNICWGKRAERRLKQLSNIDDKHIAVTGNVAFDFCRQKFRRYYQTKEEICAKYDIDERRQINLFISSFSYVDLPDEIKKDISNEGVDAFTDVSVRSFTGVIEWFDRILKEDEKQIIIYRPHPAEANHQLLWEMQNKYTDRFRVINELSVKQWIIVADKVFTWYSTAALEAYCCDVPCGILRPCVIPNEIDVEIYENAQFIENYDDFCYSIKHDIVGGMNENTLHDFVEITDKFAFEFFADTIENVLKDDSYLIKYQRGNIPTFQQKGKGFIRQVVSSIAKLLPDNIHLMDKYRPVKEKISEYKHEQMMRNQVDENEIQEIQAKLRALWEKTK